MSLNLWDAQQTQFGDAADQRRVQTPLEADSLWRDAQYRTDLGTTLSSHTGLAPELGEQEVSGDGVDFSMWESHDTLASGHNRVYFQSSSSVSMHRPEVAGAEKPEP